MVEGVIDVSDNHHPPPPWGGGVLTGTFSAAASISWRRWVYLHCPLIDTPFEVLHVLESTLTQEVDDPRTPLSDMAVENVLVLGVKIVYTRPKSA